MKIAVYSGTFDPLHTGHLAIMEYLTRDLDFDGVYLVVSPQSPFKGEDRLKTGRKRLEAAEEAVGRHPALRVKVDGLELSMEPPHYTIRTLDALKSREPENDFTLVVGADNLAVFRGWRDYRRILLEYGLMVFPRDGFDTASLRDGFLEEDNRYRIEICDAPLVNISSSLIRERMEQGIDVREYLM